MITIFTIPKAFNDHIETIQLNAIESWTLLKPSCEIVLCGDDSGCAEVAKDLNLRHLPDIACNEYGTPLINSAFDAVRKTSKYPNLCYVNADIILLNDFTTAVRRIPFSQYLMIGKRHNITLEDRLDFNESEWCSKLRMYALEQGSAASQFYIDYFVFTRNSFTETLPPFIVGRPRWDNWLVYHARSLGIPVIDASRVIMAIHQNHDYSHIPHKSSDFTDESETQWEGPEAQLNRKLSVESIGMAHQFTILDATHFLTSRLLLPAYSLEYLRKRWHSLPVLYPRLRLLIQTGNLIIRPFKWLKRAFLRGQSSEMVK